ncbi:hypothetical protein M0805_007747 [Coniferiporia weirii]|nr:hypothetical protein M0805_007747 [Coniferiporia weirii]
MSAPPTLVQLAEAATHLQAAKFYALASLIMMVYDNFLTFSTEVEKIWKRKFSGLTLLYFLNRWVFLLAVIPAYIGTYAEGAAHRCENFFRYPGYVSTFQRAVIGTVFILRTYCIYNRNLRVAGLVAVLLAVEITVKLVSNTEWGEAVVLPLGFVGCILAVAPQNAQKFVIYWAFELLTDATVLSLTIYRSYTEFKASAGFSHSRLWQVILKDGFMYFLVMCTSNLTTVIMYVTLPQDLKAINANFGVMSNSLLTARLILNLRVAAVSRQSRRQNNYSGFVGPQTTWEANLLGHIGNDFEGTSTASSSSKGKFMSYASEEHELEMR